ncbi:uncharacterized protein LOC141655401 [Silene latifolia]|uniref:uncharacterized protein LOC141655401 n=1 Tax=Silene latifolia TaxID=37657 RepID=UPI003D7873C5
MSLIHTSPWLLNGDFKCVLSPSERLGGQTGEEEMDDFQHYLDYCGLTNIPALGSCYTWTNKQEYQTRVLSRLDRALVNHQWLTECGDAYAHFFNKDVPCAYKRRNQHDICSSLAPIRVRFCKIFSLGRGSLEDTSVLIMKLEGWLEEQEREAYRTTDQLIYMIKNIVRVRVLANVHDQANEIDLLVQYPFHCLIDQVVSLGDDLYQDLIMKEQEASNTYKALNNAAESFLMQKTKAVWVNKEDDNTSYFHNILKNRQVKNKIMRIADTAGCIHIEGEKIQGAFLSYYKDLLGTPTVTKPISYKGVGLRVVGDGLAGGWRLSRVLVVQASGG